MTTISSITLDVIDPVQAEGFYRDAFGIDERIRFRAAQPESTGFRGYTISLLASQPGNVSALLDAAVAAGATTLKPAEKSLWGFGGVVQAPDGAIWTVATQAKKDKSPVTKEFTDIVVLLAASDVGESKKFYVEHGFAVGKSFGKYVDFDLPSSPVKLGLYTRGALAKTAGVPRDGSGSHRITLASDAGAFTDPDRFAWVS